MKPQWSPPTNPRNGRARGTEPQRQASKNVPMPYVMAGILISRSEQCRGLLDTTLVRKRWHAFFPNLVSQCTLTFIFCLGRMALVVCWRSGPDGRGQHSCSWSQVSLSNLVDLKETKLANTPLPLSHEVRTCLSMGSLAQSLLAVSRQHLPPAQRITSGPLSPSDTGIEAGWTLEDSLVTVQVFQR